MNPFAAASSRVTAFACVAATLLASPFSVGAGEEYHGDFVAGALKYSRDLAAQHHLVAHVSITTPEGKALKFQYDQYPEVERIKVDDELAFAKKRGGKWIMSNDWGKTGKNLDAEEALDYDTLASFVHAPLNSVTEVRDASQGGTFMRLLNHSHEDGRERFVFEKSREQPKSDHVYPCFLFERYKNSEIAQPLLSGFKGPLYTGDRILMVSISYEYRVAQAGRSRVRLVEASREMTAPLSLIASR
ncbi:hypothetical protein [Roseimicrobium sp. ORNL1]|uniref:hypothetical protein n=1 Tax=Roseimicrobium sp. ORNL1 TaxID=2711231 RepID=UPI0013E132EB|nr:hypothetical protein [Roseimicrobium sp. ORNL1]QIF02648.1 hypothetical protein G5S37_14305 [Roseimicrobium sp. ORNL1]